MPLPWNRLNNPKAVVAESKKKKPSHTGKRRIILAVTIIIAVASVVFCLWPTDKIVEQSSEFPKKVLIREVAPKYIKPKTTKISKVQKEDDTVYTSKKTKDNFPQQLGEVRNGYVMLGSGLHKIRGEITNNCSLTKSKYGIFKHSAENTIAELLTIKSGEVLIGEPDYQGSFAESLKRSLEETIEIEETDTPEQKELKQAVIEAKEELRKAMDRGEDVESIIINSRRECQDLARAKQMMMADVYDYVDKEAVTVDDIEIYVEAANKLLESKGIAPIERSTLVDIKLRHKLEDYDPETEKDVEQ